jgi:hypothetical protein
MKMTSLKLITLGIKIYRAGPNMACIQWYYPCCWDLSQNWWSSFWVKCIIVYIICESDKKLTRN